MSLQQLGLEADTEVSLDSFGEWQTDALLNTFVEFLDIDHLHTHADFNQLVVH